MFALTASAAPGAAVAPVAASMLTPAQQEAADQADLWKTLARAEVALRAMDTPALNEVVAFTNPEQAHNWEIMSRVFAADQKLRRVATA